jgi:glycosyltransferase involved in cell wall biosynthesis
MDSRPFLTVVIPTKDRPDTLLSCLKSVLASTDPDIQVIVQDNACDPRTKAVVEQFVDHRLKYSRSPIRVSMRENFELGLKKVRGHYLMFLGDDDAMSINAVAVMKQLVLLEKPDFISWPATSYVWPSASQDKRVFIKLRRSKISGGYKRVDLTLTRRANCFGGTGIH